MTQKIDNMMTMKTNIPKTKKLNREAMIRNINGLSIGDRAYCGPYGTVTCIKDAGGFIDGNKLNVAENQRGIATGFKRNTRKFSVSGSTKIHNGGNYTMASLRKAICK